MSTHDEIVALAKKLAAASENRVYAELGAPGAGGAEGERFHDRQQRRLLLAIARVAASHTDTEED